MRHLDDLDLIALGSGLRNWREASRHHLVTCDLCRERQATLLSNLSPQVEATASPPPWAKVSDGIFRPSRRPRYLIWAPVAALAILLAAVWPKVIWPSRSPLGPTALMVLTAGQSTTLTPSGQSTGKVRLTWSHGGRWMLLGAHNLPALPPSKVYEVWLIDGSRHLRAAVFRPRESGTTSLWLSSALPPGRIRAVGITIERAPGSTQPRGTRAFFGQLHTGG